MLPASGTSFALSSPMESEATAGEILHAMEAAEPTEAAAVLGRLTECRGINLARMWISFKRLLHRRGYFVATPAEVEMSLAEIEAVGEGFDLFDLARGLARFDAARMDSMGLRGHRALPELRRFST
jgi:hypothetical protein